MKILKEKYKVNNNKSKIVALIALRVIIFLCLSIALVELLLSMQEKIIGHSYIIIDGIGYFLYTLLAGLYVNRTILKDKVTNIKLYGISIFVFATTILLPFQTYIHLAITMWVRIGYFPLPTSPLLFDLIKFFYLTPYEVTSDSTTIELPAILPLIIRGIYYSIQVWYLCKNVFIDYNKGILLEDPVVLVNATYGKSFFAKEKLIGEPNDIVNSLLGLEMINIKPNLNREFILYTIIEYQSSLEKYIAISESINTIKLDKKKQTNHLVEKMILEPHLIDQMNYNSLINIINNNFEKKQVISKVITLINNIK